jgi:site-specific recombinase XerD
MRLRSKGVALEIIALILGHEQVSTTYGFYLHADIGAAERAIAQWH